MNKCCKTCKNFKDEDADGYGWCELQQEEVTGYFSYPCHEPLNNGWVEITPDNVDEVRNTDVGRLMIAVITHGKPYYMEYREMFRELDEMAILGGYYCLVLPELKIE